MPFAIHEPEYNMMCLEAKEKQEQRKLRDQFAIAALPGLCAMYAITAEAEDYETLARVAYRIADAMLDEASK